MLDLSAAFDTIDHDILLSRLCNVYGITGNALDWFRYYLTGRIQRVVIKDSVSLDQELDFGVPQGSVLGPTMYCMYTTPVSDITMGPWKKRACRGPATITRLPSLFINQFFHNIKLTKEKR